MIRRVKYSFVETIRDGGAVVGMFRRRPPVGRLPLH